MAQTGRADDWDEFKAMLGLLGADDRARVGEYVLYLALLGDRCKSECELRAIGERYRLAPVAELPSLTIELLQQDLGREPGRAA